MSDIDASGGPERGPAAGLNPNLQEAGEAFAALVDLMRLLRSPQGCPWDREQTLESLRSFVVEEAYEVVDAIDRGDRRALRGEIGDLIFEGVFLAQLCAEDGSFTVVDSLRDVADKLVRRHPHVFGPGGTATAAPDVPIRSAEQVLAQWEGVKAKEKAARGEHPSILGGMPRSLPALLRAYEIGTRVSSVGFDWDRAENVLDKIEEELRELRQAATTEGALRTEEEMGDLLFTIANLSRKLGIDPEAALRRANDKFSRRFAHVEGRLHERGLSPGEVSPATLEAEWQAAKDGDG